MSETDLRRLIPANRRTTRPSPSPSTSPSARRRRTPAPPAAAPRRASRPVKILERCNSEPSMLAVGIVFAGGDDHRSFTPPDSVLFRPHTFTDVFSSQESLPWSPQKLEGYSKDAKVVVNVTVEGSPGPIRTMVKLGSSVEETIRLVMNKYSEEGRSPGLEKSVASTFELHQSYFSLERLLGRDKTVKSHIGKSMNVQDLDDDYLVTSGSLLGSFQ
ncbi:hypothetical protein RJ639_029798 [Escallonia herrerae]|uniref:DUF7054 domain-containing protein n=1 Tax=Escallonia herrerae TaxID=1293975 RepID=A0AA88XA99_9ASTE|nr:hypothetical protein RJ639_029798 [Escallonia herrerae]